MRNGRRLGLALAAALAASAPSAQDLDALSPEELRARAEQEGQVVVYAFTSRIARVEQAYPGIDLVPFDMSSTQQIARLKAESGAGIANADVACISDAPVVQGKPAETGILQKYVPPAFEDGVPPEHHEPLLAHRLSTKVLMCNEEAHPDGAPVKNLWELTLPEWRGRVVMVDPLVRGDFLDLMTEIVLQEEAMATAHQAQFGRPIELKDGFALAGEQWLGDLLANAWCSSTTPTPSTTRSARRGQTDPPVGFTTYSDRRDNEEEGWALQIANKVEPAPGSCSRRASPW